MELSVKPLGFFEEFLQKQRDGLTGHIENAGYPFDEVQWGGPDHLTPRDQGEQAWFAYEQTAYWADAYIRLAILLRDSQMLRRAEEMVRRVIREADPDGYLGPKFMKPVDNARYQIFNRWSHVVFFRGMIALYEYNGDSTIPEALEKHYLGCPVEYSYQRNVINVEILLWLYEKTGNRALLDMAEKSYADYNADPENQLPDVSDAAALSPRLPLAHGVSYNEYTKLGAILYRITGKEAYLAPSVRAYEKLAQHFMLIDGLHSSYEELYGNGVMAAHETCNISDFTWALYHMYQATKNTDYLEWIERCIFNAGLGSVSEDFKALQYFSAVNQIVSTHNCGYNAYHRAGTSQMQYCPRPGTPCCTGNVNRFMPNYVMHMWRYRSGSLYLELFGASRAEFPEGSVTETSQFPYGSSLRLDICCKKPFRLYIRLPKWADSAVIGGKVCDTRNGGFHCICIEESGSIEIEFRLTARLLQRDGYLYAEKGCLLYSYDFPCQVTADSNTDFPAVYPAYTILPRGRWQYALRKNARLQEKDGALTVEAVPIDGWEVDMPTELTCTHSDGRVEVLKRGQFCFTPDLPKAPRTAGAPVMLQLTPYGKTMTRLTAFPILE